MESRVNPGTRQGEYWNDRPHGRGRRSFASGAVYDGHWRSRSACRVLGLGFRV